MEEEYGASTDTQFAVQTSTEVRVQNFDKFAPRSYFKATEKEDKQKGKVKRETFRKLMKNNPHVFNELEDRPHQSYPLSTSVQEGDGHCVRG